MKRGRPKGFVATPCSDCGSRGRHRKTCSKFISRATVKIKEAKIKAAPVEKFKFRKVRSKKKETPEERDAPVEGGLPTIHAYVSLKQDYTCDCGEVLPVTRQHWTDGKGRHMCMVCA